MRRAIVLATAVLMAAPAAAAADWMTVYNKDEFDRKDRFFAVTSATEPLFGFVCEAESARVKLLYKTDQRSTRGLRSELPAWAAIAIIIDDQPARTIPAKVVDIDRIVSAESYHDSIFDLAKALKAAKRRVLVAVDWRGDKVKRHEFKVDGASPAIDKLLDVCTRLKKPR